MNNQKEECGPACHCCEQKFHLKEMLFVPIELAKEKKTWQYHYFKEHQHQQALYF